MNRTLDPGCFRRLLIFTVVIVAGVYVMNQEAAGSWRWVAALAVVVFVVVSCLLDLRKGGRSDVRRGEQQ